MYRKELRKINIAAEQWVFPNIPLQQYVELGYSFNVQIAYIQTTHSREISQENK